jgi:putative DNA primase/helicase
LLVFRDELSGFLNGLDREGHEGDRAYYLEGSNGDSNHTQDRIARGTVHAGTNCLSLLGGIQPAVLVYYLRENFRNGRDDGFIQRFGLLVWPDPILTWINVDRRPDLDARDRVTEVFARLDTLDAHSIGAEMPNGADLPFLQFAPDAQESFDAWHAELERKIRIDDENPVVIAHLAKCKKLMPALALIFHLIDFPLAGR